MGIASRLAPFGNLIEQAECVSVIICMDRHAAATMGVSTTPTPFDQPTAKEILTEFGHVVAAVRFPAFGDPFVGFVAHVETVHRSSVSGKG